MGTTPFHSWTEARLSVLIQRKTLLPDCTSLARGSGMFPPSLFLYAEHEEPQDQRCYPCKAEGCNVEEHTVSFLLLVTPCPYVGRPYGHNPGTNCVRRPLRMRDKY